MTTAELERLKRLLADIEAVNPQTTFYDVARETLLWRIKGEERKREQDGKSYPQGDNHECTKVHRTLRRRRGV